jgi:hypothetical protein
MQFEAASDDPNVAIQAARWRLQVQSWTNRLVGGSNAVTGMLDIVVLTTVSSWMHADYWIPEVFGERDRPMLVAMESCNKDGWDILGRYLDEKQLAQAHKILDGWRAEHTHVTEASLLEIPNFRALADRHQQGAKEEGNLLGLVGLDPLSGLEPVARQVELIRRLGERAAYFAERAPALIGAEVDLRVLEMRATPEFKQALANVDTVSGSVKRFAEIGEKLPESVRAEREAAIAQVSKEITTQREALVHDLQTNEEPVRKILEQSQATLDAATKTSASLTEMVHAVDSFLAVMNKPAPAGTPPSPPGRPFDINEYTAAVKELGATADRLGATTRDAAALINTLDQRLPEVQRAVDAAAHRGEQVVDHTVVAVVIAGIVLIVVAAGATLFVRRARAH